ncbi:MAG: hypothetical protein EXR62_04600 [Chloroflexi bacterium]|nr:hypothetical protein [Chloroflexota bacterium]
MPKLQNVNTTDLRDAITLGCQTMCNIFNADDNDVPFFGSRVWPEAYLSFSRAHSESHVPGRHLNALLNAEDALGLTLDEDAIDKHAQAAFLSYSGTLPFALNRQEIDGIPINFYTHNLREGFHALYALVRFRNSARARELAEASIAAICQFWDPQRGWNSQPLENDYGLKFWDNTLITGLARSMGPLVKYYRATHYAPALDLALALKELVLQGAYPPDGAYDIDQHGTHPHSSTCVLSSLAQLADLLGDAQLMSRVKAFYDHGLWQLRDALGWSPETTAPDNTSDRGEANNTGDILETALILGRWGYPQYYHDAERILRGHLLPSQLRDISFIQDPPNPESQDGKRDVAHRHLGAFGFPAPYGHQPVDFPTIGFNMDIVGGAVASLCEAYREVTRFDAGQGSAGIHWVNLLFDHDTEHIQVESPYTHAALRVRLKRPGALMVRLPPWVQGSQLSIEGAGAQRDLSNGYLFFAQPPTNRPITFSFPLELQELTLHHAKRDIRARLRGDEVVAIENFGTDFTFFDPY